MQPCVSEGRKIKGCLGLREGYPELVMSTWGFAPSTGVLPVTLMVQGWTFPISLRSSSHVCSKGWSMACALYKSIIMAIYIQFPCSTAKGRGGSQAHTDFRRRTENSLARAAFLGFKTPRANFQENHKEMEEAGTILRKPVLSAVKTTPISTSKQ